MLMSHLGRPKGQVKPELSLGHISSEVSNILGVEVKFVDETIGQKAKDACGQISQGEVILLENLRFHAEEEAGDQAFAQQLAELGDIYVNDAFGTAHRAHASTEGVTKFLKPSVAAGAKALNGISLDKDLAGKNPNPTAKGAYPIATLTWVLAYKTGNGDNAKVVQDAFNYMLSDAAQNKAPSLGFVPLKGDILAKSKAAVNKIGK